MFITKTELCQSLSQNGTRVLITVESLMESLQTSETTVRSLVADLRPFKLAGDRKN